MNKKSIALLLTATIDPGNMIFLQRNDPLVRENDYLNALKNWSEKNYFSIVFCENSGFNLDKIKNLLVNCSNLEAEVLQFSGQGYPKELGKGYGELLIMRYAICHSSIIKNSDYVIKITGRYFIKNIQKIADILTRDNDIYVMADLKGNLTWADSRIFAFKPSFVFDYLLNFQDMVNDSKGLYLEHALGRAVLRAISDGHKWVPLPSEPIIIGYSGTSGAPYKTSKIRWLAGETIHLVKNYLNSRY